MSEKKKYNITLAKNIKDILKEIGENETRQGLLKTPERVSRSLDFLTQGYNMDPEEILSSAMFD